MQRNSKLAFWVLWACLSAQTQILLTCRKLSCLSKKNVGKKMQAKNQLHRPLLHPLLFWKYWKDMYSSYFGYLEYAWLHTPKIRVSTCRRVQCLSACQKYPWSITSFLRYYILKNPTIWLADGILTHNSRTRILSVFQIFQISIIVPKIRKMYWTISEKNTKLNDKQSLPPPKQPKICSSLPHH